MPHSSAQRDTLKRYTEKRDFKVTAEPKGLRAKNRKNLSFVVQKHWSSNLHYDFRLELDGVLLSWAVPKGPSYDPKTKRMAVRVEDHPVSYASFEGTIPAKQYGAGNVIVWDRGSWTPVGDPHEAITQGKLLFRLSGEKLAGLWELIRTSKSPTRQEKWLLFKKRDEWARPLTDYDVVSALPDSVIAKPLGLIEVREADKSTVEAGNQSTPQDIAPSATKAALPLELKPQLATLIKGLPPAGDWVYEIKFDGYRIMARVQKRKVSLFTRGGHDWTSKLKGLAKSIELLGLHSAWLDGEAVVLNSNGIPDFNALQNAFDSKKTDPITYFVFDIPFLDGHDLRQVPLYARRNLLKALLDAEGSERIRFSADFSVEAKDILQSACQMGLEGVIAKRRESSYVSGRTSSWLKLKCAQRQEFVVVGFNDRAGTPNEIGGLMLGYYEDGKLRSAGNVGTGWNAHTRSNLHRRLSRIEINSTVVENGLTQRERWPKAKSEANLVNPHWVKPQLVAEVSFAGWTPDGHIRHASFRGLRTDIPVETVIREEAKKAESAHASISPSNARKHVVPSTLSHPERVIDPTTGVTKLALFRYYESVADWIVPHLKGRPVSLLRAPTGIAGQHFFQKHDDKKSIPRLKVLDESLWPEHEPLLEIPDAKALLSCVQMNTVEFHTWNSMSRNINKPDRIIFDLDPGTKVTWKHVQEAALLTRTLLAELELKCWLKTSGGKGLHVVVPISPRYDYETVKCFSQAVVKHLADTIPTRFVAKSGSKNRIGKVYVDYLRNGHGQTTAVAFSARARPGLGVSMPISWEQLSDIQSGSQWTILTAREYLSLQTTDPWTDYWKLKQGLTRAFRRIGFVIKASS